MANTGRSAFVAALHAESPRIMTRVRILDQFGDPEAIDDGDETAPSKRLLGLADRYQKVFHGTIAAQRIGLPVMRERCRHFAQWVGSLENVDARRGSG